MLEPTSMSLLSTNDKRRLRHPLASLRTQSSKSRSLLQSEEPFTLVHNLRTRPLAFVAACVGLMGVLAVKVVLTRAEAPTRPGGR